MNLLLSLAFLVLLPLSFWLQKRTIASASPEERGRYEKQPSRNLQVFAFLGAGLTLFLFLPHPKSLISVALFSTIGLVVFVAWDAFRLWRDGYSTQFRSRILCSGLVGLAAVALQSWNVAGQFVK